METNKIKNSPESSDSFGIKLRFLRQQVSITRSTLASLTGISEESIKSWERNRRHPTGANIAKLIEVFKKLGANVKLDWLYEDTANLYSLENNILRSKDNFLISTNLIVNKKVYNMAYKRAIEALDSKSNKHTLTELFTEIQHHYQIILLELNKATRLE